MIKLLYVSSSVSGYYQNMLYCTISGDPGYAAIKFNRLFARGFANNGINVSALCNPPITYNANPSLFVHFKNDEDNKVNYIYIPFINRRYLKHICVFVFSFIYTLMWGLFSNGNKVIICDVLSQSASLGSLLASKIIGIKSVGIITDLPWLVVPDGAEVHNRPNRSFVYLFSHYVLLTDYMNNEINIHNKPYVVVEGLCERDLPLASISKFEKPSFLYAGSLMEKYGIARLVDSFLMANEGDWNLIIMGDGPFSEKLLEMSKGHSNIIYRGLVSMDEVFVEEMKASVLVNPRPVGEDYTKYSFPSKIMEYMSTGTPVLSTKLPGIPMEYEEYLYYFEDDTVEGMVKTMRHIMSLSCVELMQKGRAAREYVINEKNNIVQAKKVTDLFNSIR